MTTEERFERIEALTAGLAEERRKDREEYKNLWRDTQRHMQDTQRQILDTQRQLDQLARHVDEFAVETRLRMQALAQESASRDAALDVRLDRLVSAIGEFIAAQHPPQP